MNRRWSKLQAALVVSAFAAFAVFFMVGIKSGARLETDLDEYMPSDHPAFVYSDESEELFGIEDAILIAVEHPDTVYNSGTLEKIRDIAVSLADRFPEIDEDSITSLYTAENITADEWGLTVESFYDEVPSSGEALSALERTVRGNRMIQGKLVSDDGRSSLIIAEIADDAFSPDFYSRLQAFADEQSGPETIHIAGRPVVEGEMTRLGPKDMSRIAPLVFGIMIVLLLIIMRSVRSTAINMIIVTIGTLAAFGGMAWLGIPVYTVSIMIPVMLIAIGVADGIHLHNTIQSLVREDPAIDRETLITKTMKDMTRPVIMTSVTTAVGFLSLMTSEVLPVRYFGLFTAAGVLVEMAGALLLFPASIRLLGVPRPAKLKSAVSAKPESRWIRGASRYTSFLFGRATVIVVAGLLLLVLFAAGAGRVWIDTSFLANFQKDSDIVRTDAFVNEHFGGTSTLNVIFSAEDADAFKEPDVLRLVSALQKEIETDPVVGKSFALTDYVQRMHRVMHEDDPAYDVIPDDREMIAQYLLLYEMSGDPENLDRVVDYDYKEANLAFQLKTDSSARMKTIVDRVETWADDFGSAGITIRYAGSGYKSLVFSGLLLKGQISGLFLSFLIVFLLIAVMFRNILIGLVGSIPIAFTAVVNFGTMGLTGIPLSSSTAIISGIAIGIGIDYAIHFIEHYLHERAQGASVDAAAAKTVAHTGRSILHNALAVIGGFAVLLTSLFPPNRHVGALVALNMGTTALVTLTLFVVILSGFDRKGKIMVKNPEGGSR